MNKFDVLTKSLHIPTLLMGLATVLIGTGAAFTRQPIHVFPFILCILFVCTAQMASNCNYTFNEIRINHGHLPWEGRIDSLRRNEDMTLYAMFKEATTALAIVALTIGVVLSSDSGIWAVLVGIVILALCYINLQGTTPLVRSPFAPIITFILFGPLGVFGTFLVQADELTVTFFSWFDVAPALYLGTAIGFLAVNVHLAMNFITYRFDILNNRITTVTAIGHKLCRWFYLLNGIAMWAVYNLLLYSTYFKHPIIDSLMPTLSLIFTCFIWTKLRKYSYKKEFWTPALLSILNMFLLALGAFILFASFGRPADSIRDYF